MGNDNQRPRRNDQPIYPVDSSSEPPISGGSRWPLTPPDVPAQRDLRGLLFTLVIVSLVAVVASVAILLISVQSSTVEQIVNPVVSVQQTATLAPFTPVATVAGQFPVPPTATAIPPTVVAAPSPTVDLPVLDGSWLCNQVGVQKHNPTPDPTYTATQTPDATTCGPVYGNTACTYRFAPDTETTQQLHQDINSAMDTYHIPHPLAFGVASLESGIHQNLESVYCDRGLFQIKEGLTDRDNLLTAPDCGITSTTYDPDFAPSNSLMGAKLLRFLICFYSGSATTVHTAAWYYAQQGLSFPDTTKLDGTPNPASLCASVYQDPAHAKLYALLSAAPDFWSCPFSAKAGDYTVLDLIISAYNEGTGDIATDGVTNGWYIAAVEKFMLNFANS